MSEQAAETAAAASVAQQAAEETPLPGESRQSLDALGDRPTLVNGTVQHGDIINGRDSLDEARAAAEVQADATAARDMAQDANNERTGQDAESRLQHFASELERVTGERDTFQSQYRGLLGKLTSMRATLGDKLRQDAEELDRKEQQINSLQAENEDMQATIETLKNELIASNEDGDRLHSQVEQLRLRADDSAKTISDESAAREAQLREVTEDLERCRLEREEWENEAMKERVERERLSTSLQNMEREFATIQAEKQHLKEERDREAEAAHNLHTVLEEFQAAKDKELRATLGDMQDQVQSLTKAAQEYRQRAHTAEAKLSSTQSDSERVATLQQEVKEKSLLIGKIRHEAVILNEHLTEALRRLKKDQSENNVDRRLVTNVLLTFLTTPRADAKRFEMLSLLSSILSWSDDDREKAGLQRTGAGGGAGGSGPTSKPMMSIGSSRRRAMSRAKGKGPEDSFAGAGEDGMEQSFSNLWVEYLLKESQSNSPPPIPEHSVMPISSPPFTSPTNQRNISPFAELARPSSPTKSSTSQGTATNGRKAGHPMSRQRSDTDTSESVFSRTGDAASTAPTSVASGYS